MQLIDTHVHINFDVFSSDLAEIALRWQEAGVVKLIHSCVEPTEFSQIQTIANQFPEISFAVGLHPLDAHKWSSETQNQILNLAQSDRKVVAIGETGLDFYKAQNTAIQQEAFWGQLIVASQLDKPVIIHCRQAASEMTEILKQFIATGRQIRGVMHCWSGTPTETQWFLDLGFYISFSGIITFKQAKNVQESAKIVPIDKLLIETDCPFLAPVPNRGKRNEPSYVKYVAQFLSELRGIDLEILAQYTTNNAIKLFKLEEPN